MTEKSIEIAKLIIPDQVAASHLKKALIQSADSVSTRRNREHFWKKFEEWCEAHGAKSSKLKNYSNSHEPCPTLIG